MQSPCVDGELDPVTHRRGGPGIQACDDGGFATDRLLFHSLERFLTDIDGELLHVLGHRLRDVDVEVHQDVRTERLAEPHGG